MLSVLAYCGLHGFLDNAIETVLAGIAFFNETLNDLSDLAESFMHFGRMLPRPFDDLRSIPNNVVLAHGLEPKRSIWLYRGFGRILGGERYLCKTANCTSRYSG